MKLFDIIGLIVVLGYCIQYKLNYIQKYKGSSRLYHFSSYSHYSAAMAPTTTASSPPAAFISAAPLVDDGAGASVELALPPPPPEPASVVPVGVYRASPVFVKLDNRAVALPVIWPAIGAVAPVQ